MDPDELPDPTSARALPNGDPAARIRQLCEQVDAHDPPTTHVLARQVLEAVDDLAQRLAFAERALAQAIGDEHLEQVAEVSEAERDAGATFIDVWSGLVDLDSPAAWDWWLDFLDRHTDDGSADRA